MMRAGKVTIGEQKLTAGDIAVIVRAHRQGQVVKLALDAQPEGLTLLAVARLQAAVLLLAVRAPSGTAVPPGEAGGKR